MEGIGKLLVGVGLGIALFGALVWLAARWRWIRIGHLPGDIAIERHGFSIYVPIASMLILSAVTTLVLWVVGKIRG